VKAIEQIEKKRNNEAEVEKMINAKFYKRMQEGKLGGLNLSFVRAELQNNLTAYQ